MTIPSPANIALRGDPPAAALSTNAVSSPGVMVSRDAAATYATMNASTECTLTSASLISSQSIPESVNVSLTARHTEANCPWSAQRGAGSLRYSSFAPYSGDIDLSRARQALFRSAYEGPRLLRPDSPRALFAASEISGRTIRSLKCVAG